MKPQRPWLKWFIVLLSVYAAAGLALAGAWLSGRASVMNWTMGAGAVVACAWLAIGAVQLWREPMVRLIACGFAVATVAAWAYWLYHTGHPAAASGIVGVVALIALFFGGLYLIKLALWPGLPTAGIASVARTVIDEAIRLKVAIVFIAILLILVPMLPVLMDADDQLKYRIQRFLHYSLSLSTFLLSILTILLACRTITSDLRERQVFLSLTKPLSRWEYLAGKWLGIVLLNLLLLAVAGGGVYAFTKALAAHGPGDLGLAVDMYDRRAVDEQVLVARQAVMPQPPPTFDLAAQFNAEVERMRETGGDVGEAGEPVPPKTAQEIMNRLQAKWHSIGRFNTQAYVFTGLDAAARYGNEVQLRLKPRSSQSPPDGLVHLAMRINGRPWPVQPLADDNVHVLSLPVALVDDSGTMYIEIANVNLSDPESTLNSTVSFTPGEGLQLLYRVGTFEGNLVRALLMIWLRLAYLTMLGLAAGTFLGFPVACLLSLLVFLIAQLSGFLTESLSYYAALPSDKLPAWEWLVTLIGSNWDKLMEGKIYDVLKVIVGLFGKSAVYIVPSFSEFNPVPRVSDGLIVTRDMLSQTAWRVGVVWTGVLALGGWLIFRKRELAKVTV